MDDLNKLGRIIDKQTLVTMQLERKIKQLQLDVREALEDRKVIANALLNMQNRLVLVEKGKKGEGVQVYIHKPKPDQIH